MAGANPKRWRTWSIAIVGALAAAALGIVAIIAAQSRDSASLGEGGWLRLAALVQAKTPPSFRGNIQDFRHHDPPKALVDLTFESIAGDRLALSHYAGKVVLLNYWATWCAPCIEEMPALDRLQAKLGGEAFVVLAVSVDRQGAEVVGPFVERLAIKHMKILIDRRGETMRETGVRGLPTTLLVDRQGREVGRIEGAAAWASKEAEALIRFYLDAAGPRRAGGG